MGNHLTTRVISSFERAIPEAPSAAASELVARNASGVTVTAPPPIAPPPPPNTHLIVRRIQEISETQPDLSLAPIAPLGQGAITASYIMDHQLYTKRRVHTEDSDCSNLPMQLYWYMINLSKLGMTEFPADLKRFIKLNVLDVSHNCNSFLFYSFEIFLYCII